jgi:GrpB-like predicted nucleotidyltransferase (UPF0157 family)
MLLPKTRLVRADASIVIEEYNRLWPEEFLRERQVIETALAPWLIGAPEHIGSTAVPGLAAKPVIDIMAPVHSLEAALPAMDAVARIGYVHFPYRPEVMHWFCKPSPAVRTHHLHLIPLASSLWVERLAFRDALRARGELRARYEELKRRLALIHRNDREAYTDAKSAFISTVLGEVVGDGSGYV